MSKYTTKETCTWYILYEIYYITFWCFDHLFFAREEYWNFCVFLGQNFETHQNSVFSWPITNYLLLIWTLRIMGWTISIQLCFCLQDNIITPTPSQDIVNTKTNGSFVGKLVRASNGKNQLNLSYLKSGQLKLTGL